MAEYSIMIEVAAEGKACNSIFETYEAKLRIRLFIFLRCAGFEKTQYISYRRAEKYNPEMLDKERNL